MSDTESTIQAEIGVIGSILLMNEAMDEISNDLHPEHFSSDANRKIYSALLHLRNTREDTISAVKLAEELVRRGELDGIGGPSYLCRILEAVPHAAHVRYYATLVREASELRG